MQTRLSTARETDAFGIADLLFSRTDARGVIQSGNGDFQRVSGYDWDDLLGAPHKLIRHAGMPKGLFQLMWETIGSQRPIGAYTCNKTREGLTYTVFAVVIPVEDGFVSVRLKPTSPRVAQIKDMYDRVCAAEHSDKLSAQEGAALLRNQIEALGFSSYEAFMARAIQEELGARNAFLERTGLRRLEALSSIESAVNEVRMQGQTMSAMFAETAQIPQNLRLQASRIEGRKGPISMISTNHQMTSDSFAASLTGFLDAASVGAGPLREAIFLTATAKIMMEVADAVSGSDANNEDRTDADARCLRLLASEYLDKSQQAVRDISARARYFTSAIKDMRRMVAGLELTRTMCKIEKSRVSGDIAGLNEIVERLHKAEAQLNQIVAQIGSSVSTMKDGIDTLNAEGQMTLPDARMHKDPLRKALRQA